MKPWFLNLLLWLPAAVYLCFVCYLTYRIIRDKEVRDAQSFAKGKSNYSAWVIFLTVGATFVGPGYSVGYIDRVTSSGILYAPIFILATLHLLAMGIALKKRTKLFDRLREHRSIGDFVAYSYGRLARTLTGIVVGVEGVAFAGVICFTGATVLESVYGISQEYSALLIAVLIALYAISCGIPGVLRTETIQMLYIALLAALAVGMSLHWLRGGVERLERETFLFSGYQEPESLVVVMGLAVSFLLGEAFQPYWLNRSFFARSGSEASRGFIWAWTGSVAWFLVLGGFGLIIANSSGVDRDSSGQLFEALYVFIEEPILLAVALGVAGAAFLGIVMSTLDSIVNAAAVSVADDVFGNLRHLSEEGRLAMMRLMVLLIALGGAFLATLSMDIVDILLLAYTVWVPLLVPQLGLAFFGGGRYERNSSMFLGGAAAGVVGYGLSEVLGWHPYVPSILVGFLANILVLSTWMLRKDGSPVEPGGKRL